MQFQCNVCHEGSLLADNNFHNIGVRPLRDDAGRFTVSGNIVDQTAFRTPGLRNSELRGPFMHNGRFSTLEEVVEFYNRGGDFPGPNVSQGLIRPLNLTPQQKAGLVAFLKRPLTDAGLIGNLAAFLQVAVDRRLLRPDQPAHGVEEAGEWDLRTGRHSRPRAASHRPLAAVAGQSQFYRRRRARRG
jgi:hypothetical protein